MPTSPEEMAAILREVGRFIAYDARPGTYGADMPEDRICKDPHCPSSISRHYHELDQGS